MLWRLGTSSQLQMIADDLVIAKIPSFSTVVTFDGWNLPQEHVGKDVRFDDPGTINVTHL